MIVLFMTLLLSLFVPALFFIPFIISLVFAEEVITILPGSMDENRYRFVDISFYPIEIGKEVTWYNGDTVNHRLIVSSVPGPANFTSIEKNINSSSVVVADSGIIEPNDSFAFKFDKGGTYDFYSPLYPWINGTIYVTDGITTITETDSENDIDVQLSWTPFVPSVEEETHFKIIFINRESDENQKHIDYKFSIDAPNGQSIALQSPHSGWGVESASHEFVENGDYKLRISIFMVQFIPVEVGSTEFGLTVSNTRGQ